jgi:endonuclease/exonuclease/phosphatase family metal-dependent hydrolase
VLRAQNADLVALQEANHPLAVETLAEALGMQAVYGDANSPFAVAWLSRVPIERSENHRLPILEKTLLEIEVASLRLFATHLSAGRTIEDEPRRDSEMLAVLERAAGGQLLVGDFNAVHPEDEVGTPPPEEALEHVSRHPIELALEAGFTDCFRTLNPDDRGWTYLASHPWARLDYVFANGLEPTACRVVTEAGEASDHFPVVADLT